MFSYLATKRGHCACSSGKVAKTQGNIMQTTNTVNTVASIQIGRFNGAFKNFAANWFHLVKFYGLDPKVCHKIATDAMSALGVAMSKDGKLDAAVSKANKNGESSFKISGKSGLTQHSYAMSIVRICQLLEKIREEGLTYKPLKLAQVEEFVQPTIMQYVSECEAWAAKQVWDGESVPATATPEESDSEESED